MRKLRITPLVYNDLMEIKAYIAEDNDVASSNTISNLYVQFENIQIFPEMGVNLSKRVKFKTHYKYIVWENYIIIYLVAKEYVEIYRVINRYQDITRIFD